MNKKLIRIAKYLANNGLYKEAAQLQKIGQEDDLIGRLYEIYFQDEELTRQLREATGNDERYVAPGDEDSELKIGAEFISIIKNNDVARAIEELEAAQETIEELEQENRDMEEYGEVWENGPGFVYRCRVPGLALEDDELRTLLELLRNVK